MSRTTTAPGATRAPTSVGLGAHSVQTLLLVTVWAGVLVPQLVHSLTVPKGFTPISEDSAPLTGPAALVTTAANVLIVLVCLAVVLRRRDTLAVRRLPLLALLLAPWVIAAAQLSLLGRPPGAPSLIYPAVVVAFWALRPGRAAVAGAVETVGYLTGATAVVSLLIGAVAPAAGRYELATSGLEKTISPVGVLSGLLPSGNNLGLLLVVGLPTVWAIRRLSARWVALGAVVVALGWTMSRTSWIAAIVVVAVMAAVILLRRPGLSGLVAGTALGALAVVGAVLPFAVSNPDAFTHRAGYWIPTLAAWRDNALTGFGADYFKRIVGTPADLGGYAYHAHNQWVQLLITGGLLLSVSVLALLVLAGLRAVALASARVPWAAGWLAGLLAVSILEVPLGFVDRLMFVPVTLVPLCLLLCADRATTGDGRG